MPSKIRLLLASFFAIAALGAAAPAANAYIYYSKGYGAIGRASNDGANANAPGNKYFLSSPDAYFPAGIAVDSRYIYWVNAEDGTIRRAKINGTQVDSSFISSQDVGPAEQGGGARGLAVNSTHIYWTRPDAAGGGAIGRARIDGSNPNKNFLAAAGGPFAITLTPDYIYWGGTSTIGRAQLNGADFQPNFFNSGTAQVQGIAVYSGHIYTSWGSTDVARYDLDGSNPTYPLTGQQTVRGLLVDDSYMYWAGQFNAIGRADLNGLNPDPFFINPPTDGDTSFLAVDSLPRPSLGQVKKPTKTYLKVRVGCGDAFACTVDLTGAKVGGTATLSPKSVSIGAGNKSVVKFTYSAALRRAVARGGQIKVTADNQVSGGARSITLRVSR